MTFLVSQLRSLNNVITQCFLNIPWLYVQNLPSFFYTIFLPNTTNQNMSSSSSINSIYDSSSLFPMNSLSNSKNHYDTEVFSDSLNYIP